MQPISAANSIPEPGAHLPRVNKFAEAPKRFTAKLRTDAPPPPRDMFFRNVQRPTFMSQRPLADLNEMRFRGAGAPASISVNRAAMRPMSGSDPKSIVYAKEARERQGNFDAKRRGLFTTSSHEFYRK